MFLPPVGVVRFDTSGLEEKIKGRLKVYGDY